VAITAPSPQLTQRSATDLAAAIRNRQLTAREVVQAHVDRLHARQPRTNALACDRFADALAEADQADERIKSDPDPPPFLGVPCTIKESFAVEGMPNAVACAAYHYLSNSVGGVTVEFMRESDRKAWVNFVPPRWIYPGASICGVPSEVSRAFLRGWYAQNGVSLGNPRLGFVCTAQTTDGQHGLSGYFLEHDLDLSPEERVRQALKAAA